MSAIATRLNELGITLPTPAAPAANYVPTMRSANQLFVSGQLPLDGGKPRYLGRLGDDLGVPDGQAAARLCAINILAQVRAALDGDLERIVSLIRLGGFVQATPAFNEHHLVVNGASDFLFDVLGERGRHARFAVGMASLPLGVAVEVDATLEVA